MPFAPAPDYGPYGPEYCSENGFGAKDWLGRRVLEAPSRVYEPERPVLVPKGLRVCGALQQGCKGQSELACSLLTLHVGSDASANKRAILQVRRWPIAKGGTPAKAAPLQGQPQQELHVWLLETVDWLWPQKIVRWLFNDAPTEALADRSVMPFYPGASGQLWGPLG